MSTRIPYTLFLLVTVWFTVISASESGDPVPVPWPEQFHSVLFINYKGVLQVADLWYDWPNGRNFLITQTQLGELVYDVEWNNKTSFDYTLDDNKKCRVGHFQVGILRPDWLQGAEYLGQTHMDGFLCNVWTKVDFIWYYEDVASKRPVYWRFKRNILVHAMTFEVGKVLPDPYWQAPVYCFNNSQISHASDDEDHASVGRFMDVSLL